MDLPEHGQRVFRAKLQAAGAARMEGRRGVGVDLQLVDRRADGGKRGFGIRLGVE